MTDDRGPKFRHGTGHGSRVSDINREELDAFGEIVAGAGRQVVERRYFPSLLECRLNHVTAYETRTTRNQ